MDPQGDMFEAAPRFRFEAGRRLGAYEIVEPIGAGGMGAVYRARDTRLGRDVAIKVLPDLFTQDAERLARFRREAQILAALNHPNIGTIYGIDEADGAQFLVLELVDGGTLADRIDRKPLPLDDATAIARQIALALQAAHAKGIVHRDLKPSNVGMTRDGAVKVLDFGLAKAIESGAGAATGSPAMSPTLTVAPTQAGMILGTAAYMAPEQAKGRAADKASDLWSFGCVLYEMLTGRRAFQREDISDTLAAVLTSEPDWTRLPPSLPPPLDLIVRRCLRQDRGQRIGDASVVLFLLEEPARPPASPASRSSWPWALLFGAVASVALVVAALAMLWSRSRGADIRPVTRLELSLPEDVDLYTLNGTPISIAPDGRSLALIGRQASVRSVYLRRLDQADVKPIEGTQLATSSFFSADGSLIGVTASDGTVKKVSLKDGLVSWLASGYDFNSGGAIGSDGRFIVVRDRTIWRVPADGGAAEQLTRLDAQQQEAGEQWPVLLPGERAMLFTSSLATTDEPRIEAMTLADGKRHVVERGVFPMYLASGHLVFLRNGELLAAPFDAVRLQTTGAAVRVVENVLVSGSGAPVAAVSATGTLVYAPASAGAGQLTWVSRQGVETPVSDAVRNFASPRLSPDGRRIVVVSEGGLWLQDTLRPVFTRLTAPEPDTARWPVWTHDGRRVYYRGAAAIRWVETDGSGRAGEVPGTSGTDNPIAVSPDDGTLAFVRVAPQTGGDIYVTALGTDAKPRALVTTRAYEGGAQFSPDGHWLAYASNESGQFEVYVRPYPSPDRRVQVSSNGGNSPLWSGKGSEIFYRSGDRMMAVAISTRGPDADPLLSAPRLLFERKYDIPGISIAGYDVSADGQRFVFVKRQSTANRLNVVLNWTEELKQRVPSVPVSR